MPLYTGLYWYVNVTAIITAQSIQSQTCSQQNILDTYYNLHLGVRFFQC